VRDADRFDEFYRGTRARVLQFLYAASGGDLAEAQDAAAEAYSRAWQRWDQVGASADPEAWVRVVGWRVLASGWRKLRGRATAYRRHGPAPNAPPPTEESVALVAALRQLPLEQRVPLVLHHIVELPVTEIAAQTGVPVGTVKSRLSRGRQALAAILETIDVEVDHA
jgi:RNA polymerase sigma factor (sigma-70 family)